MSEELSGDSKIFMFQEKVNRVNDEIEAGLSNLERMIEDLKKKKVMESQVQFKQKAQERVQKLEREFAERRAAEMEKQRLAE